MQEKELRQKLKKGLSDFLEGLQVLEIREDVVLGTGQERLTADLVATVKIGKTRRKLVFSLKQRGYPRDLEYGITTLRELLIHKPEFVPVLAAPFISESGRALVRQQGMNFVDLSGNVHVAFDNVLIRMTSPGNKFLSKKEGIDIFSDRASLVLRALIAKPDQFLTVRALAEDASISVGWASEVLGEIEERGYLERKPRQGCRIIKIESLLDDWTNQYEFLSRNRIQSYFINAESLDEILGKLKTSCVSWEVDLALTVHAGAHLVAPFVRYGECHVYLSDDGDFDEQAGHLVDALGLVQPYAGGNFHIVRPYYRKAAFFQARTINNLVVASDLQLYLDLFRFPVRGREQAEKVLEQSGLREANGWS